MYVLFLGWEHGSSGRVSVYQVQGPEFKQFYKKKKERKKERKSRLI
jgi:hypothetical protein